MTDYQDVFGAERTARARAAGLCVSAGAVGDGQGGGSRPGARRAADRRGGDRHRQDLCLSRARAAVRAQRDHLHRHAHAAGPVVSPRCARCSRRHWACRSKWRCSRGVRTICAGIGLELATQQRSLLARRARLRPRALARVSRWAAITKSGDLSELTDLPEQSPVWPMITSTRENCLGQECPQFSRCHVFEARRAAQAAEIVVVNHHLLLADLALKDEGFGDLLPGAEAVILDEAHQVPDIAAQFFGQTWSVRQVQILLRDAAAEMNAAGVRAPAITSAIAAVESLLEELRASLPAAPALRVGEPAGLVSRRAAAARGRHRRRRGAARGPGRRRGHCQLRAAGRRVSRRRSRP